MPSLIIYFQSGLAVGKPESNVRAYSSTKCYPYLMNREIFLSTHLMDILLTLFRLDQKSTFINHLMWSFKELDYTMVLTQPRLLNQNWHLFDVFQSFSTTTLGVSSSKVSEFVSQHWIIGENRKVKDKREKSTWFWLIMLSQTCSSKGF